MLTASLTSFPGSPRPWLPHLRSDFLAVAVLTAKPRIASRWCARGTRYLHARSSCQRNPRGRVAFRAARCPRAALFLTMIMAEERRKPAPASCRRRQEGFGNLPA
ncbi:hypothetical protein HMPREF9946_01473 [Acetobacteraceae bacterium AT-5844]|nr:hypothetical protein HMPREF9946_01473 [Acetobacteraceae bacterium AT-5844]